MIDLKKLLTEEKQAKRKGGLYHKTQVSLAYNSNRIEGSRLSEDLKSQFYHIINTQSKTTQLGLFNSHFETP